LSDADAQNFSRREFVLGAAASALSASGVASRAAVSSSGSSSAPASGQAPGHAPAPAGPSREYLNLSAVDAVAAMKTGALTAERYAGALLERCASLKYLNAFITLDPSLVLEQAH
jgi:hypothetical protein